MTRSVSEADSAEEALRTHVPTKNEPNLVADTNSSLPAITTPASKGKSHNGEGNVTSRNQRGLTVTSFVWGAAALVVVPLVILPFARQRDPDVSKETATALAERPAETTPFPSAQQGASLI
ncbi:MAG TPA: hypothetical protein VIV60_15705, partial [Polyangiaceae bacterium]